MRFIQGRLGDLGVIDEKYDVAVTTACGSLNDIVVDTVETGQKCIAFLKSQNLGRGRFMCLDKLSNRSYLPISTPEDAFRLFDLIQVKNPSYLPAFYQGISNTLVAEDMTQANRLAFGSKQRWRVVTLEGKLIDVSGTMSGGGHRVMKGGMNSSFSRDDLGPKDLTRLESQREDEEAQLSQSISERNVFDQSLNRISKDIPRISLNCEKLRLELINMEQTSKDLDLQIKVLR